MILIFLIFKNDVVDTVAIITFLQFPLCEHFDILISLLSLNGTNYIFLFKYPKALINLIKQIMKYFFAHSIKLISLFPV